MQDVAARIPNSQLALLRTMPWLEPTEALAAIDRFLAPVEPEPVDARAAAGAVPSPFRTILFTDLESSTALTQRLGDDKAQEVLRSHNAAVRSALTEHGGEEVKHTGDGIMASFPSAVAALEAALAMQRDLAGAEVRVRIGLNAGEPIAEEDDLLRHRRPTRRPHHRPRRTGAGACLPRRRGPLRRQRLRVHVARRRYAEGLPTSRCACSWCSEATPRSLDRRLIVPSRIFAAIYDPLMHCVEPRGVRDARGPLVGDLSGEVLEVGAGTGANFAHYGAGARVTATDYSPYMIKRARRKAMQTEADITVQQANVENLPFADGQFDHAIATLAFCSVDDPAAGLGRDPPGDQGRGQRAPPGGTSVRTGAGFGGCRDWITPFWRLLNDGCHLNRDTVAAVERAGLTVESVEDVAGTPGFVPWKVIRARVPER